MLFTESLSNRSPSLCALVIREETPYPPPVVCPTDGLTQLTRQYPPQLILPGLYGDPSSRGLPPPVICDRISLVLRTPSVFVRMTWEKTRGLLEFQVLPINPRHCGANMAVKRRPTVSEGVAYQLAD